MKSRPRPVSILVPKPLPSPDYRANPKRAIYLSGLIDFSTVERLTPRILEFFSESREPITIYVDSVGGIVYYAEALRSLLKSSDQDVSPSCRIITCATTFAASAAADFLTLGDYAMAYPNATIHFHGQRSASEDHITEEAASGLVKSLRSGNNRYALITADVSFHRFLQRYVQVRADSLTDLLADLRPKISETAQDVLHAAELQYQRYSQLASTLLRGAELKASLRNRQNHEESILKALLRARTRKSKPASRGRLSEGGLNLLVENFHLFTEYFEHSQGSRFQSVCDMWGEHVLPDDDKLALRSMDDERRRQLILDRARPILSPLWLFFISLCQSLQKGENSLTAHDAYWLGLIDEVVGDRNLLFERHVVERPDLAV